jgi:hypothetical protein
MSAMLRLAFCTPQFGQPSQILRGRAVNHEIGMRVQQEQVRRRTNEQIGQTGKRTNGQTDKRANGLRAASLKYLPHLVLKHVHPRHGVAALGVDLIVRRDMRGGEEIDKLVFG